MDAPPVQYVTTSDGYDIAYTVMGQGQPFVYAPGQFSHVHTFWGPDAYIYPWWAHLASRYRLICFDGRGQGMSSRNLREPQTLKRLTLDLDAVAERATTGPFVLMAQWHFCHVAVHYAVARPENLAGLILVGCSVEASAWPSGIYRLLPDENWDAFVISQLARNFLPQEAVASFARIQTTITKEDFLQRQRAFDDSDIAIELTKVTTPTLLIHPKDFVILRHEESIRSAAAMPNSRLVMTEGGALPGDSVTGLAAIDDFIAGLAPVGQTPASELNVLSQREVEVLRLLAGGRSNQQIADELVISINTVRRHVSNVFDKIGAENRAQAAVYARDHGLA